MLAGLLIPFLSLAHLVFAKSLLSVTQPNHIVVGAPFNRLSARQSQVPAVPAECRPDCDPIHNQLTESMGRCPPADCCNSTFVTEYFNCLKCFGQALNVSDFTQAQSALDGIVVQCSARGLKAPKLTLPGIDPNRPLPSATQPGAALPQSTISILSSASPSLPPPPLTATGQATDTTLPATSGGQAAPQPSSTSSAKADRFLAPRFSHLTACAALFVGFICFVM